MNDTGDFGRFEFYIIGMPEAETEAYFNKMIQSGWESGWGSDITKDIQWKGHNWYCTVGGGSSYDGLVKFEVSFRLNDR